MINYLIYQGFMRYTPLASLKAMPRYLAAIAYRLEKGHVEVQKIQEFSHYGLRYWKEMWKKIEKSNRVA